MAKKNSKKSTGSQKIIRKLNPFKVSLKYMTWVFFILLGGFLFNLDRMGDFGLELLKHKELLPYRLRFFLPGGTAQDSKAERNEIIIGRAIEVYDGDTISVVNNDKKYRIRFYGIDAPESRQEHGKIARNALREKILGKEVSVTVKNLDRYGRAVGKVSLGSRDINLEMVKEGHAWHYISYAKKEHDIAEAEKEARANKLGLWQNASPMPPWDYRVNQKK